MAAIIFARRVTTNIFKASIKDHSATTLWKACFSTAFKRPQGSSGGISTESRTNDPARQGMYEARRASRSMADTAKQGLQKATQVADTLSDAAKKTMDGAWDASKEANEKIRDDIVENDGDDNGKLGDQVIDEVNKLDGPVDTAEYRSMEKLEDLKVKPEDRRD